MLRARCGESGAVTVIQRWLGATARKTVVQLEASAQHRDGIMATGRDSVSSWKPGRPSSPTTGA